MSQPIPTDIATKRMLAGALKLARADCYVFPCHGVSLGNECECKKGSKCKNTGKHPIVAGGFTEATKDEEQIKSWWTKWPNANIGLAAGLSGLVVVDIDPRSAGNESLSALERTHGILPETPRALTGGGGLHYYFKKPPNIDAIRSTTIEPGVDIKADGGYVIAPESLHGTGVRYCWDVGAHPGDIPFAVLPAWLVKRLDTNAHVRIPTNHSVSDGLLGASFAQAGWLGHSIGPDKAAARCPWEDEHTGGERMDGSTIIFAPAPGKHIGYFFCSHGHCKNRQTRDVLSRVPESCVIQAREQLGLDAAYTPEREEAPRPVEPAPVRAPASAALADDDWKHSLTFDKKGLLKKSPMNATLILMNDERLTGLLSYDSLADKMYWTRPPPEVPGAPRIVPGEFKEEDLVWVSGFLDKKWGVVFSDGHVAAAVNAATKSNARNPLQEYLNGVKWDGIPRVEEALIYYGGAPDTAYVRHVTSLWLVSAVARAFEPGCQVDHMMILEGPQGVGKTTWVKIMGGEWELPSLPDLSNGKDAADSLNGYWVVEVGELSAFGATSTEKVKDFMSRSTDVYRPPYARLKVSRPRTCVFIGTTNDSVYLRDATGARRYLPVPFRGLKRKELTRDRDQIWAEAVQMYREGKTWHPDQEMIGAIAEEQEKRFEVDAWEEAIESYLESTKGMSLKIPEIMDKVLKLPIHDQDSRATNRISKIMRRLGYERDRVRTLYGKQERCWVREGARA